MSQLRAIFTDHNPGPIRWLMLIGLRVLRLPYIAAICVRNWMYSFGIARSHKSALPVVSVGNLSVGGTGKSPVVAWLAAWFREHDLRVAILSRGYGALDSGQNDEAIELELKLPDVPHLQHWDRIASARLADEELQMQLLVLDDGFQHRRLQRDVDIVLIDATDPPAALWPLPGGLLREPFSSLKRADVVIVTRADQVDPVRWSRLERSISSYAKRALVCHAKHAPKQLLVFPDHKQELDSLRGKPVLAFCGIGNPQSFFESLTQMGADVVDRRVFPDHHGYSSDDMESLIQWTKQHRHAEAVVCTVKDWVKLQTAKIGEMELAALAIELQLIKGKADLETLLDSFVTSTPGLNLQSCVARPEGISRQ